MFLFFSGAVIVGFSASWLYRDYIESKYKIEQIEPEIEEEMANSLFKNEYITTIEWREK